MPSTDTPPEPGPGRVCVVVGVDGSGRSHRMDQLAALEGHAVERVVVPVADLDAFSARLAAAAEARQLVVVDDVHRLDAGALHMLTAAARDGLDVLVSRRPTIGSPALAELDEVLAARGAAQHLRPLDAQGVERLVARVRGQHPPTEEVERILHASAGLPATAAALALASGPGDVPALAARVERRLALTEAGTADLARVLAVGVDVPDDVLATSAGIALDALPAALRSLADMGLLVPDGERLVPAVADAVEHVAGPAGRRAVRERLARALVDGGADPLLAARLLREARARGHLAARAFAAAADVLRISAPADALGWLEDADDAGGLGWADHDAADLPVRATRAEAAALLGMAADTAPGPGSAATELVRLRLVAAAIAAHQGRTERCADLLAGTGILGRLLAVPAQVATGRPPHQPDAAAGLDPAVLGPGPTAEPGTAPPAVRLLADAARGALVPADAVPLFIDAAEALEAGPPALVLPDTAHALGALVAVCAGDSPTAEHLLGRAGTTQVGGPVAADRHRLLLAWVRMRTGRFDTALAEVRRPAPASLTGRDRLVRAALLAGLARRSGDIARLRQAWAAVEPELARRAVDLFHVEVIEELAVAAARLRLLHRIMPVLDLLEQQLSGLGRPAAWDTALGWVRLQMAVATDDPQAAQDAAERLEQAGPGPVRQVALRSAARTWAAVVTGTVDEPEVASCVESLATADLPWEASRLAGQAAITGSDPGVTRRLLERARELSTAEPDRAGEPARAGDGAARRDRAGLSEREVEVSRLVLEGRTHREVGAQLYLSPKTVEHHVARIRTKLGATSRAELLASLRDLLG